MQWFYRYICYVVPDRPNTLSAAYCSTLSSLEKPFVNENRVIKIKLFAIPGNRGLVKKILKIRYLCDSFPQSAQSFNYLNLFINALRDRFTFWYTEKDFKYHSMFHSDIFIGKGGDL